MRKSATTKFEKTEPWIAQNVGDEIEGRYTGKEEFDGNFGPTVKYIIERDGTKFGVYGSASLNRQFAQVPTGSYVWVKYEGKVVSKNGREVKSFTVDYDDEI